MAAPVEQEFVNTEQVNNAEAYTRDKFREQFKRYKRKKPPPDLCDVVDFAKSDLVSIPDHTIWMNRAAGGGGGAGHHACGEVVMM